MEHDKKRKPAQPENADRAGREERERIMAEKSPGKTGAETWKFRELTDDRLPDYYLMKYR